MAKTKKDLELKDLAPAREAAARAGVSVYTIYRWIDAERIPGTRIGGRRYVNRKAFEKYVRESIEAART